MQEIIDNADTLLKIDCVRFDELDDSSDLKLSIIREGVKLYEKS
ncbi:nucleotidyltransferase [Candidatus Tisiphia endosymbiont of Mystacides longicornis]